MRCVRQDQHAIRRAAREQKGERGASLRGRITRSFVEDAIGPASRGDTHVLRGLMRSFHMHESPTAWTKRPDVMARVLLMWARTRRQKADLYPPSLGPARAEMLSALNLQ